MLMVWCALCSVRKGLRWRDVLRGASFSAMRLTTIFWAYLIADGPSARRTWTFNLPRLDTPYCSLRYNTFINGIQITETSSHARQRVSSCSIDLVTPFDLDEYTPLTVDQPWTACCRALLASSFSGFRFPLAGPITQTPSLEKRDACTGQSHDCSAWFQQMTPFM